MYINIQRYLLVLTIVSAIYSCGNNEETPKDVNSGESTAKKGQITLSVAQFDGSNMKIDKLIEKDFPVSVAATGVIDVPPENKAVISSFADGYVRQTPLLIGDSVKKGQFLLSLENPEYIQMQQDYLDAMEQMKYLKSEYERQKTLIEENITSEKNYLKAESDYKRNFAKYQALRKKLQMLNLSPDAIEKGSISSQIRIYSPITGSITEMNINNGMYVSAAQNLMQIIDRDHLHIELDVFEKDLMNIKKDQEIKFSIPEANNDTIEGEVHLVGTSINSEKRTVKVHGHFKDESLKNKFATGMFVEAQIQTAEKKAKALPTESIVSLDNTNYVLILVDRTDSGYVFKRREVKLGDVYNGFTVITNSKDFKPDDQFVTKGAFPLIKEE